MLVKLKTECGYQFTSKLESMFTDIKTSRDTMLQYRAQTSGQDAEIDLSVQVGNSNPQTAPTAGSRWARQPSCQDCAAGGASIRTVSQSATVCHNLTGYACCDTWTTGPWSTYSALYLAHSPAAIAQHLTEHACCVGSDYRVMAHIQQHLVLSPNPSCHRTASDWTFLLCRF